MATMIAGPDLGSLSLCRILKPRTIRTTSLTMTKKNRNRNNLFNLTKTSVVEINGEVKEKRRCIGKAINSVEDAAVSRNQIATIFDS